MKSVQVHLSYGQHREQVNSPLTICNLKYAGSKWSVYKIHKA